MVWITLFDDSVPLADNLAVMTVALWAL